MKGVYLCAREHRILGYDIDYNDVVPYEGINLYCSCEDVDLTKYDFIIATPPCNYWSHANFRRDTSIVALNTKKLLPYCLKACLQSGKLFIVENVCNEPLMKEHFGDLYNQCWCFQFGNHTFWSNIFFFVPNDEEAKYQNKQNVTRSKRDNNFNVDLIIKCFLKEVEKYSKYNKDC